MLRRRLAGLGLALALLLCLPLASAAVAQDGKKEPRAEQAPKKKKAAAPLVVSGDTQVIVLTLPCKVTAPAGGSLYDWQFPDNVKASDDGANVLTITDAPKGSFVVRVRITVIDFEKKVISREAGEVTVVYGPPGPPPPPADPLAAAFQRAYDGDGDADRAASLAFLQAAYKGMAAQAPARTEKTNAQFVAWMKTVIESPTAGLKSTQLRGLRTAVGAELQSAWGAAVAPLSAVDAAAELSKVSAALARVK